ncbi:MAG: hypothetical protein AB1679_00415 [Actinomycetota bacterium]
MKGAHVPPTTRSYCRFCGALRGVLVEVDQDRVLSARGGPDHPLSHGYTCPKGRSPPSTTIPIGSTTLPPTEAVDLARRARRPPRRLGGHRGHLRVGCRGVLHRNRIGLRRQRSPARRAAEAAGDSHPNRSSPPRPNSPTTSLLLSYSFPVASCAT